MVPNGKLSDIQITAEIPIIPQPDIYNLNTGLVWYLYPYCNCRLKRIYLFVWTVLGKSQLGSERFIFDNDFSFRFRLFRRIFPTLSSRRFIFRNIFCWIAQPLRAFIFSDGWSSCFIFLDFESTRLDFVGFWNVDRVPSALFAIWSPGNLIF